MSENKILQSLFNLRNNGQRVQLVTPNGATHAVLGTSSPEEEQRRANIVNQWRGTHEAPRQAALVGIEQPLDQRTQSILYYQLPESARQRVNRGPGLLSHSRKSLQETTEVNLLHSGEAPDAS